MHKSFVFIVITIMILAISSLIKSNLSQTSIFVENVELLTTPEAETCYAGGPGATECSISAGIEIAGVGVSVGCSVSCGSGYYACCSIKCRCIYGS